MASGKTLERLRQLYSKVDTEVKRWNELQVRSVTQRRTDAAACGRAAAPQLPAAKQLSPPFAPPHRSKPCHCWGP